MADYYSDQMTKVNASPVSFIKPNESEGRVRVKYFSITVPTGNIATAKTISLCKLPKGARVLKGRAWWEAMTTGAGTAQVTIGIAGTASKYLGTTSVDSAGEADFANTQALNMGAETTAEEEVLATTAGEAWAATKKFEGYILYVKD